MRLMMMMTKKYIGRGASGQVYIDTFKGETVAVKQIKYNAKHAHKYVQEYSNW